MSAQSLTPGTISLDTKLNFDRYRGMLEVWVEPEQQHESSNFEEGEDRDEDRQQVFTLREFLTGNKRLYENDETRPKTINYDVARKEVHVQIDRYRIKPSWKGRPTKAHTGIDHQYESLTEWLDHAGLRFEQEPE